MTRQLQPASSCMHARERGGEFARCPARHYDALQCEFPSPPLPRGAAGMSTEMQAILDAALALPEGERELLVGCLLESLSPGADEMSDDEFYAELERRAAELEQDPSTAIP